MKSAAIILLCILASIGYGVIHDQITARICVEYFTIGHPPIFGTDSPTLLGLGWGVLATWWVGLILGIGLAVAARFGPYPKCGARMLIRPVFCLLLVMALCASVAGVVGEIAAKRGWVFLVEPMASAVPKEKHVAFLVDLWTHIASYSVGFLGGAVIMIMTWRKRKGTALANSDPQQDLKHPDNAPGKYWVDCNACSSFGICTDTAPRNFRFHSEHFTRKQQHRNSVYVFKQPENEEEEQQCQLALEICPVAAIHKDEESSRVA